jgi:hypothetical protein
MLGLLFKSKKQTLNYYIREENEIFYLNNNIVPMFDWDIPKDWHHPDASTFKTKEKVYDFLNFWGEFYGLSFAIYETPGGVHGWVTNKVTTPRGIITEMKKLMVDPFYRHFCIERNEWACRVSPKREGDYIGRFKFFIGSGEMTPEAKEILEIHDQLIMKYRQ